MSDFWQTIITVLVSVLIASATVYGHPGALNDENCHRVQSDWEYKSGKTLKKDSYHCHGRLNDMALDGRNMLEDQDKPVTKETKSKGNK
jgi:hypothetical protein